MWPGGINIKWPRIDPRGTPPRIVSNASSNQWSLAEIVPPRKTFVLMHSRNSLFYITRSRKSVVIFNLTANCPRFWGQICGTRQKIMFLMLWEKPFFFTLIHVNNVFVLTSTHTFTRFTHFKLWLVTELCNMRLTYCYIPLRKRLYSKHDMR